MHAIQLHSTATYRRVPLLGWAPTGDMLHAGIIGAVVDGSDLLFDLLLYNNIRPLAATCFCLSIFIGQRAGPVFLGMALVDGTVNHPHLMEMHDPNNQACRKQTG